MTEKHGNMHAHADAGLVALTAVNFRAEVLESKLPVLVEFWTPWSRPCQVFDSVLLEVARELEGRIKVVKVDADDSIELSLWHCVHSIPTLIYFVEGEHCWEIVGTASKQAILEKLKTAFK